MPEVVVNGSKLWDGTTVRVERPMDGGEVWIITPPGGGDRILQSNQELVVDGKVVKGTMEGWWREERSVGSRQIKPMYYRGSHAADCEQTENGWLCGLGCQAIDAPAAPSLTVRVDHLIAILEKTKRRWFRVYWDLSRQSVQRRYLNGRARKRNDQTSTVIWHRGKTWTKRGARKEMAKFLP